MKLQGVDDHILALLVGMIVVAGVIGGLFIGLLVIATLVTDGPRILLPIGAGLITLAGCYVVGRIILLRQ